MNVDLFCGHCFTLCCAPSNSLRGLMHQDTRNWPLIAPLPSYGRGRELPGGRYMSFIHGDGIHDVVITGRFEQDLIIVFCFVFGCGRGWVVGVDVLLLFMGYPISNKLFLFR